MIYWALLACLLCFTVGSPLRRQDGSGNFGYNYDVKHPGGSSSVHVRAGGDRNKNSFPANADYISDASYVNPHFVEPHYQPNRYGHYPTNYDQKPFHGQIRGNVPVYEEHSKYPKPAVYQQVPTYGKYPSSGLNAYGAYPAAPGISQSTIDSDNPAVDPAYSNPKFVQQTSIDDDTLSYPPPKFEQIPLEPKPIYEVQQISSDDAYDTPTDVQVHLDDDAPIIGVKTPKLPIHQQVLIEEPEEIPVISQKSLDDQPVFSQVVEDIPFQKNIPIELESPIVQQSSVDVSPPSSGVEYMNDDPIPQVAIDPKGDILIVDETPVVQQVPVDDADSLPVKTLSGNPTLQTTIDDHPSQAVYDSSVEPSFSDIDDHSPAQLFATQPKYRFVPVGSPYEKISHSTEIIHGPHRSLPDPHFGQPLNYQKFPSVKNSYNNHPTKFHPPPPVTKSVIPVVLPHQQEHIDVPLTKNYPVPQSVKLPSPPAPVTKSLGPVIPVVLPQEHIDVPLTNNPPVLQSVKLPPPPPPPVIESLAQEHVDVPVTKNLPVSQSIKLPPPPPAVTKSVGPVISQAQEHIDVPLTKNPPLYQSVKLPPPPPSVIKSLNPVISQAQEHIDVPLTKNPPLYQSVKLPPPPPSVTKSLNPVISQAQEHIDVPLAKNPPVYQSVKLPPPPPPVTKSVLPAVLPHAQEPVEVLRTKNPSTSYSIKLPPANVPVYNSPTFYKPVSGIKAPPYGKVPMRDFFPGSHSIKQPYSSSYHVKTPYLSKPPLTYVPLTKSPVPYSVKHPYAAAPVLPNPNLRYGNPHVKSSSYFRIPAKKTPPLSYGIKYPVVSNGYSVKHPNAGAILKDFPHVKGAPRLSYPSYINGPSPGSQPVSPSVKHPYNNVPVLSHSDSPVGNPHIKSPPQQAGPVKKYLPITETARLPHSEPREEIVLNISPEAPLLDKPEEKSPFDKYPASHAFRIPSVITSPESKSELSSAIKPEKLSGYDLSESSPLDKYPPVSHAIRLPESLAPVTQVPNLFAAVPAPNEDELNSESLLNNHEPVSHAVVLPSPIAEAPVSALRIDALSSPVSHSVRLAGPRHRGRADEPKQDFPAFPVESAYRQRDPVSEKVAHLTNSFKPSEGYFNSNHDPGQGESSNSPSVGEAKLEIDRVNKEIGSSFGDRISGRSRFS